jgi:hypothetical protein
MAYRCLTRFRDTEGEFDEWSVCNHSELGEFVDAS